MHPPVFYMLNRIQGSKRNLDLIYWKYYYGIIRHTPILFLPCFEMNQIVFVSVLISKWVCQLWATTALLPFILRPNSFSFYLLLFVFLFLHSNRDTVNDLKFMWEEIIKDGFHPAAWRCSYSFVIVIIATPRRKPTNTNRFDTTPTDDRSKAISNGTQDNNWFDTHLTDGERMISMCLLCMLRRASYCIHSIYFFSQNISLFYWIHNKLYKKRVRE